MMNIFTKNRTQWILFWIFQGLLVDHADMEVSTEYIIDNFMVFKTDYETGMHQMNTSSCETINLPIHAVQPSSNMVYQASTQRLVWAEGNRIYNKQLDGTGEQHIDTGQLIQGVAIDERDDLIYYIDSSLKHIGVLTMDGTMNKVIITADMYQPQYLVLDSRNGFIYWSDIRLKRIEKASIDGTQRQTIAHVESRFLAIDTYDDKLFWSEDDRISLIYLEAPSYRITLKEVLYRCYGMAVSAGRLYVASHERMYVYYTDDQGNIWYPRPLMERSLPVLAVQQFVVYHSKPTNASEVALKCVKIVSKTHFDAYTTSQTPYKNIPSDNVGIELITRTFTMASPTMEPILLDIVPTHGPEAGGTTVTISGYNFWLLTDMSVRFGDQECIVQDRYASTIICVSSFLQMNALNVINTPLPVSIGNSQRFFSSGLSFTYMANPVIFHVEPLESIMEGGVELKVSGEHLDSVVHPLMKLRIFCKGTQLRSFFSQCEIITSLVMICLTPNLTAVLPEYCKKAMSTAGNIGPARKGNSSPLLRRKRSPQTIRYDEDYDVEVYIGFILDGYLRYQNMESSLPQYSKVTYYYNPKITRLEDVIMFRPFWPYHDDTVTINGERLTITGSLKKYFAVQIGTVTCENVEVFENSISIKPPKVIPQLDDANKVFRVLISIGHLRFYAADIKYISYVDTPAYQGIIAGGTLLGIMLLLGSIIAYQIKTKLGRVISRKGPMDPRKRRSFHRHGEAYIAPPSDSNYIYSNTDLSSIDLTAFMDNQSVQSYLSPVPKLQMNRRYLRDDGISSALRWFLATRTNTQTGRNTPREPWGH